MPVTLDIKKYAPHLENLGYSQTQIEEILQFLWQVAEERGDIAFKRHPVQLACGESRSKNLQNPNDSLDSKDQPLSKHYGIAANDDQINTRKDRA